MKSKPSIETQHRMVEFFMRTSAPRLLAKEKEEAKRKEGEAVKEQIAEKERNSEV